jgi:hypothetical protein
MIRKVTILSLLLLFALCSVTLGQLGIDTVTGTVKEVTGVFKPGEKEELDYVALKLAEFPQMTFRMSPGDAVRLGLYLVAQQQGATVKKVSRDLEGKKVELTFKKGPGSDHLVLALRILPRS